MVQLGSKSHSPGTLGKLLILLFFPPAFVTILWAIPAAVLSTLGDLCEEMRMGG